MPSIIEWSSILYMAGGALLAKGRLLGIQFVELFRDNLYFDLAKHANKMASILREEISKAGYSFLTHSPSNQIFPILPNNLIEELQEKYSFYIWSLLMYLMKTN